MPSLYESIGRAINPQQTDEQRNYSEAEGCFCEVASGLIPNRERVSQVRLSTSNESQQPTMTSTQVSKTAGIPPTPIDFENERKANVSGM